MINNYDSVVACPYTATPHSQKQESTSYTATKRNWLSFVTVLVTLFCFSIVQGQSLSNYTFTTGTNGTLNDLTSGSTSYLTGLNDDTSGTVRALGFNFTFMGVSYSHFSANSNGQMQLHTTSTASAIGTNVTTSAGAAILAPFTGDNELINGMRYTVIGSAPNRTFVLEWNQFYVNFVNLSNAGNMQVWLEETTGKITYIYGNIFNSSTSNQTRSISISSSNTATTVGSITISSTPTFTVSSTLVSNTIAAGANPVGSTPIANIGSLTEGSRRFFSFTPASSVASPTSLSFSSVTSAGTTVNWVDNSTTEYGFLLTRATDAGFTANVVVATVASTTSAAIGQAYTAVQTGLLPSTTYYYKVQALSEAVISSDINGSQATNAPGTFISVATGNFGTAATWDIVAVPTQYDSVTIDTGHTVTIDATGQAANNVIVKGILAYGATPTSFAVNGNLTVDAGGVVNVFNGTTGKTLTVAGNITNNGTMDVSVGTTTPGNLTLNGSTVQTVAGTGTFNTSVIRNLTFSNTSTVIPNINWGFNNISVDNNLNIANAKINLNSNKLIFGTSVASSGGTFTVTNGGFLNGTFSRWWSNGATGYNTTGPTSVPAGSPGGRYPFFTSTGEARILYIGRTTPSAGGKFAVTYNNATTSTSGQNITDGTYVITDRWDGNFVVTTDGTSPAAASYWVTIFAPNAFYTSAIGARIIGQSASISGTHVASSSLPIGQRSGVSLADLTSNTGLYLGINDADIPFISVANGDWENPSTWNKNAVPSLTTDIVYIANGTTVGVNATAAVSSAITIFAGGTLNVAGSTLGVTGSLINNGTLNVSGGAMSTTTTVTNGGTIAVSAGSLISGSTVTNNASSTITVSGTGTLTSAGNNTLTNSGTINANGGTINVSTTAGASTTGITNNSGATLSVAGGTVNVGPAGGGNRVFSNAGTLALSSGAINLSGNFTTLASSTFNMTGGTFTVDGNSGDAATNGNVAVGTRIFEVLTATGTVNGGTIVITDPHNALATTQTFGYSNASAKSWLGNTLQLGDGSSTNASAATRGFELDNFVGSGILTLGNVIANGGSGANRFAATANATANATCITNLTVNANSEFRNTVATYFSVEGNITNNGTLTIPNNLVLGTPSGTATAVTQTISGSGTFRNATTSPTASLGSLLVNNSNATGVTLSAPLSVSGTLTMISGIINTTNTNLLTLGTATAAGTLAGTPSATNMIKGPFARTIATANANTNYILFPVGKAAYTPISLAPATTAVTVMKAEAFDSNTGTQNAAIINLTTARRWEAPIVSGTVTDVNVRLADAGILASSIPVQAPTATGEYTNSFGSVATAVAGATTQSNTAVTSANYTGFLSYADSNACSGTPAPGNTIPSTNAICLGTSVTLSLQNATSGTGVTYQWKSSTDGTTYTAISGATNATLTVTPSAPLYYLCDVTCATGPATGTSTAVQITFSNSVTATTPGTRCGTGTVDLSATPSTGASIKWYAAETGGTVLGTGNSFTTPSIAATTTYYAGSETSSAGSVTIGNGTTLTGAITQPSAFVNRWDSYRIQTLYTAAELNAAGLNAGNITSMSYFTTTLGDGATNSNFIVKIGSSSQTSMTTTWVPTTSFTTVYGPVTHTHTASGEQPINFTTPFNWDGVSNIVIEVMYDGADISNNAITFFTATTNNMVVHSDINGSAAATGSVTTTRLNLKLNGQVACQSARVPVVALVTPPPALTLSASTATICESNSTAVTLTSTAGDYNTYTWSPSTGIVPGGDENTGWTFNPSVSTNYTLTATQTGGSLCTTTATFAVTVNPRPSAMTITPSPTPVCVDAIHALSVSGGTLNNVSILSENFNASTNSWTVLNTSTGGTPADANWTLRNSGYVYSTYGTFSSNDASQFYLSNSDDQGSGGTTNTALISPSFATTNFTAATVSFWHYFRQNGTAKVQYSIDGGTAWTDIQSYTATTGAIGGFVQANLVLPAGALNQANVKIRFKYDAVWQYFWAIDNVSISGTQAQTITWLPIDNLYTDASATIPYVTNGNASTVYFKSSITAAAVTYTATSTTSFGCSRTATTDVTVNSNNTVTAASSTPTVCINTAITDITHTTTGATGFATTTTNYGLPAGVTAILASNTITISGTPTASGTFNYDIPLTGGCGTVSATGTITVTAINTASAASSTPTVCINTAITDITHTTTGATGIAMTTTNYGLPAGVTAVLASNTITISGTPTASGTFNYDIPLTGGCGTVSATGTITVSAINTVSTASSTPTVCINTAITDITHTTTGATGFATTTTNYGLPAGVLAVLASNTITISGTPTASGTFNYDIPLTGGCGTVSATGTITVNPQPIIANKTTAVCTTLEFSVVPTNGIDTVPSGTTYTWSAPSAISGITGLTAGTNESAISGTLTNSTNAPIDVVYQVTPSANVVPISSSVTISDYGRLITYAGVNINGQGNKTSVTAGSTVTISYSFSVSYDYASNTCPGCVVQIYTGIGGTNQTIDCQNGIGDGSSGNINTSFTAPTTPGTYYLTHTKSLNFVCGPTNFNNIPSNAIGVFVVGSNTYTCSGTPFNVTVTVNPTNTVGAASSTPTLCSNTALTDITHTTTGATGIATTTTTNYGLPAGVTANWSADTITISGTPTASGTFNYDIPLAGGCGTVSATGTITVTANNTASAASSSPTVCINTAITDITHTTTGATGFATTTTNYGLPAGVTAVLASNTITISGTPTASGTFNYDIPLTGGCGTVSATGTITVTAASTNSTTTSACGTYTWSVNGTTYTTSGTYTSVVGCLTETLNLTINALPITAITRAGDDLTATETGATYQWYTCTSGSVGTMISGATTQSYTVTATGSYAVEVTKNGCSEMSACFDVATLSGNSFDLAKLSYYPNPVIDVLTISYTNEITAVQVYDISGRLVRDMKPNSNEVTVDLSDLAASVYVVKVFADTTSGEFKVVKK